MRSRPLVTLPFALSFFLGAAALAQQPLPLREGSLDMVINRGLGRVSVRTGERIVQDPEVRVIRRNNRRPVAAGLLVRVRTPESGPSATFGRGNLHVAEYRTDDNGDFVIRDLVANAIKGSYELEITVDWTGADGTHYSGFKTLAIKNVGGGLPGWVKYGGLASAAGAVAYFAGPWRPGGGPDATISYGQGRVGSR